MTEKRQIILLSTILICCVGYIAYWMTTQNNATVIEQPRTVKTATQVGGDFTLVNGDGQTITAADFGDTYKIIFFGFTNCPGICPGELTKISSVLDMLEQRDMADKFTPLFISIDPARDTPEVIKDYVAVYDSRIIGLTGSQEQIDKVKDNYKIHASKVEMEMMEPGNYMMDHSTFTYLMSPENELLLVFDMQDKPLEIFEEIKTVL